MFQESGVLSLGFKTLTPGVIVLVLPLAENVTFKESVVKLALDLIVLDVESPTSFKYMSEVEDHTEESKPPIPIL